MAQRPRPKRYARTHDYAILALRASICLISLVSLIGAGWALSVPGMMPPHLVDALLFIMVTNLVTIGFASGLVEF